MKCAVGILGVGWSVCADLVDEGYEMGLIEVGADPKPVDCAGIGRIVNHLVRDP